MKLTLLLASILVANSAQQSKLQLIEEALEHVLMTHSVNYEKGNKLEGKLADVTVTYTGNTVIDASGDSSFYNVFGSYTYAKYTYVQTPNPLTGGTNSKSYNSNGSRAYMARVKSVLDDYRVQEIIVIEDPDQFDFARADFDSLKQVCDWIYPTCVYQSNTKRKSE